MVLPSNIYKTELRRAGYESWKRTIELNGASVEHFDYPLLLPTTLSPTSIDTIAGTPSVSSQSPDRRWLLVSHADSITTFSLYDLKNPTKAAVLITLPSTILSTGAAQTWQTPEWADDNQHLVLGHRFDDKNEYILIDKDAPDQSVNLVTTLGANPTKLTLNNKKYDQYYLYDSGTRILQKASLKAVTPLLVLDHVLGYQSFSDDTLLYATDSTAPVGKASIRLKVAADSYTIRLVPLGASYVLDLAAYNSGMYIACGSSADTRAFVYRDPVGQTKSRINHLPVPVFVAHVSNPNYLSFSVNTQYILAENGAQISVYDIQNKHGYNYSLNLPIDSPMTHVKWMDGNRLTYVSSGKLRIIDYDQTNARTLIPASSSHLAAFSPDFTNLYTLTHAPGAEDRYSLTQTSLLAPTDR